MFFKDIETWSKKKLIANNIIWYSIYFILVLVAPLVTIFIEYDLFVPEAKVGKLSGLGLMICVCFAVIGLRLLKKKIELLPAITYQQQCTKYICLLVYSLMIPVLIFFVLTAFKDNFTLAFETSKICVIFISLGICIDHLFIKFLEHEAQYRNKALEANEIEKRR